MMSLEAKPTGGNVTEVYVKRTYPALFLIAASVSSSGEPRFKKTSTTKITVNKWATIIMK